MRRLSLAGQLLVLQMAIVVLIVLAVAGVSSAQADNNYRESVGRRMLSSAETLATNGVVRTDLREGTRLEAMRAQAEITRTYADADYVIVLDRRGRVRSATVPLHEDGPLRTGSSTRFDGSAWTGVSERYDSPAIEAHVPVLAAQTKQTGQRLGYVIIGSEYPSWWQILGTAAPSVLGYLALAAALGGIGSFLLSRRVKRQTLGLEPTEITDLVRQREAMLHGIREGVLGVDPSGRITFANDEATRLLGLGRSPVGQPVGTIGQGPELTRMLSGQAAVEDHVAAVGGRLVVLNSMPVRVLGTITGSVTTMRDRTQLLGLQRQLAIARDGTDTLRAQVHEFRNRLHVISGLVELGEDEQIIDFIGSISRDMNARVEEVSARISDTAVAALLVAKKSRAEELGIGFVLAPDSSLDPRDSDFSGDLVTVIGNLVDNAFDAVATAGGQVRVRITDDSSVVTITVEDNGPGFSSEQAALAFQPGWSSKQDPNDRDHGWGLALTRLACQRHGGAVELGTGPGSCITATLHHPGPEAEPATHDPLEEALHD